MGRRLALLAIVSLAVAGCADDGVARAGSGDGAPGASEPSPDVVGEWLLSAGTDAEGSLRNVGTPVTLALAADGTVAGMAPCNSYGGEYTLSAASLSFGELSRTEMACAALPVESRFFAALEKVTHVQREGEAITLSGENVTLKFTLLGLLTID
jgi:heat shock protein HslJ